MNVHCATFFFLACFGVASVRTTYVAELTTVHELKRASNAPRRTARGPADQDR
jgi:hypothetical protein